MPTPPRTLVLALPKTSYAKPKRGAKLFLSGKLAPLGAHFPDKNNFAPRFGFAKLFLSGKLAPLGAPGSPGKTSPVGALGKRCDCSPGTNENDRPWVSYFGPAYS